LTKTLDFAEYKIGVGGPDKGLGIKVALVEIGEHGFFQLSYVGVASASHTALGHVGE
jgi:hypothetical protein